MNINTLLERLEYLGEDQPDRTMLDGTPSLTSAQLVSKIQQKAYILSELTGRWPIVIKGSNSMEWLVTFLAARAAGLFAVPLPSESTVVQYEELESILGPYHLIEVDEERVTSKVGSTPVVEIPPLAGIGLLTSGSTGTPRCALRTDASLLAEGQRYAGSLGLTADDQILICLPLCHAFTLGFAVGVMLTTGCSLYLVSRFLPRKVNHLLCEGRATILPLVPSAARLLCETFSGESKPINLRCVLVGAGPVSHELEQSILERLGYRPARGYGSSETGGTLGTTGQVVPDGVTGAPLPGVEISISDASDQPRALFVRTAHPFLGYLSSRGIDASRVSPDGWYSTGDLAVRDRHGWIKITGRIDDRLRRGGRFIQPIEVASALQAHPAVADAVVKGSPDEHGEDIVEAHIELVKGVNADAEQLRLYLAQRLESYKIPTSWRFYESLPRSAGGKVDTQQLMRPSENPVIGTLAAIAAHRLSTAVTVAWRLGIIEQLSRNGGNANEVARVLGLDPEYVAALLEILVVAGVVVRAPGGSCQLVEPLSVTRLLISLESKLRSTWLSDAGVEEAIRAPMYSRPFELKSKGQLPDEYYNLMASSARLAAIHAWRQIAMREGGVLDIGRPAGSWADLVHRHAPNRPCSVVNLPGGYQPFAFDLPVEPLAAIFIHNGVRRFRKSGESQSTLSLREIVNALCGGGILIISDIFTDTMGPTNWLKPSFMLDWLTHGNFAWPAKSELLEELEALGFSRIWSVRSDALFDLVLAEKQR